MEIVIDAGDSVRVYVIAATRAGRRVEVTTGRSVVEVAEVTRGGNPVRTARFMANRVLALVEHPAAESAPTGGATGPSAGGQRPEGSRDQLGGSRGEPGAEGAPAAGWDW